MSAVERLLLATSVVVILVGVIYVGQVLAQSPQELQRQIDRLQNQVDGMLADGRARERDDAQRLQVLHERIAALERETELNRKVIWGFISMLIGNFGVSALTLQRVSRLRPNANPGQEAR
jgi:hypothetical protein